MAIDEEKEKRLLGDSGMVDCAAELLNEAINALVGDQAGAETDKDFKGVTLEGISLQSAELQLIRETFRNMQVIGFGTPEDDPPETVPATGELEVLRAAVEQAILENINCGQNDWIVLSLRHTIDGKEYLEATVSGAGCGSPEFVQDWVDTINLLFDLDRIHQ